MLLFAIPKFVCSHEIGMSSLLVWKSPNFSNHYCECQHDQDEKRVRENYKNLILGMPLRTIVNKQITTIEFNKQGIIDFIFFNEVFYFYFLDLNINVEFKL